MDRCFSTLGCGQLELAAACALAQQFRINRLELRSLGGTLALASYLTERFGRPEKLAAELSARDMRVVALDTSLKLNGSTGREWRETAEAFLPWAEALGGVNLRVFDGGTTADAPALAVMADRLRWWRALRAERRWQSDIMIETHNSLCSTAANLALLRQAPFARILWDSHHTWKRGGEDPAATWEALRPHIVHIHVKDSVSRPSARHPYTYVRPGEGEFPAGPLMKRLRQEFDGPVSLEWEQWWHPDLPPLAEALRSAEKLNWW